jgi:2,3-dihydroxy-2,3-dihydro-p-cumate dehydrogenase
MTFDGRAAIVTGAASPIGAAIAQRLASQGASLALGDVDGDGLAKTVANLEGSGADRVVAVPGDLATPGGAAELTDACRSAFGRLDILVNNAGGGVLLPTLAHTEDTLRTTIDRNLWTAIYSTLAALPHMVTQRYGRIVNLGAESVRSGIPLHAVYNAAKGGVHGFTPGRPGSSPGTASPSTRWRRPWCGPTPSPPSTPPSSSPSATGSWP